MAQQIRRNGTGGVRRAAKVALLPGFSWNEAEVGTNAVGTALVERRPMEVRGAEHYSEANGILFCAAAPIHDPFGELVGLLDLSGYQAYMDGKLVDHAFDGDDLKQSLACIEGLPKPPVV